LSIEKNLSPILQAAGSSISGYFFFPLMIFLSSGFLMMIAPSGQHSWQQ